MKRRRFLQQSLAAATAGMRQSKVSAAAGDSFSFALLGDLHYAKLEHHDMAWLEKHKAGDLGQIKNYSRITNDLMPLLFASVRDTVAEAKADFVLHVGDLVEGLCGSEELAARQNREALEFVTERKLAAPFLFTKGNHDVTGDGAPEAFAHVFHPFLSQQRKALGADEERMTSANYTLRHGDSRFCFFDAYDKSSLEWLEAALAQRTEENCFVIIHPPVVPYGARSTWHLFSSDKQKPQRAKLLALLGAQQAFVLGGHIHKFNTIVREAGKGRFVQLAVSSVVGAADVQPKDLLGGLKDYTGDQIRVEPNHSPETEKERRAVYDAERPFVRAFAYADLPGHALVNVKGPEVTVKIYSGVSRDVWREVNLTRMLKNPVE